MSDFNPIADLSYRNYDGPLKPPAARWWTIARQTMRAAAKNKWLWSMSALCALYYVIMMIELFVFDRFAQNGPAGIAARDAFLDRIQWNEQFLHGISYAQMPLMLIALVVGAGAIANDNRANALLVYLSKPCTKFDYAFGKWMGVFLVLCGALAVPGLGFYAYGALSFRELGFFHDPWLVLRLLATIPLCAALNASIVLAISSLFKQGRLAGAVYAGIYFMGYFFTVTMGVVWQMGHFRRSDRMDNGLADAAQGLVGKLYYASVDGLQIGLSKALLGAKGVNAFGTPGPRFPVPAPPLAPCLVLVLVVTLASIAIAWSRVRAVEVVG